MDWNKLDQQIIRSPRYKFFKKHERLFIFIQGLIVIGLLFGIVMYTVQDHEIKQQIKERCGYTTSRYECICDPVLVEGWKELKQSGVLNLNLSNMNLSEFDNG